MAKKKFIKAAVAQAKAEKEKKEKKPRSGEEIRTAMYGKNK